MVEAMHTTEFQQILELAQTGGLPEAILAVGGFVAIYYFKRLSKIFTSKMEEIVEQNNVYANFNHNIENKIRENIQLKKITDDFMYKTGAFKVLITQFHNGGKLISGVPFLKSSVTHEFNNGNVANNTDFVQKDYLQIPISFYTFYLEKLKRRKLFLIPNIESIKNDDSGTYIRYKKFGAKSVVMAGLYKEDCLVGYISILFKKANDENFSTIKKQIENFTTKIDLLLTEDTEDAPLEDN